MNLVLGLTGGTGCGKSAAARYLEKKGAFIIDADEIARNIVAPGEPALCEISAAFHDVLLPDGTLNRKKLGALVFADKTALHALNKITHPHIMNEIKKLLETPRIFTVIDAPLLFECGLDKLCSTCLCVLSDPSLRLKRIMERDQLTKEAAETRIKAQPTNDFYASRCQFVIENNKDIAALESALDNMLKELTS